MVLLYLMFVGWRRCLCCHFATRLISFFSSIFKLNGDVRDQNCDDLCYVVMLKLYVTKRLEDQEVTVCFL
jgi:hypothetical protein